MKIAILFFAIVALSMPALAAERKGIDFTQAITDQDDKPLAVIECVDSTDLITTADGKKDCRETKRVVLTLGIVSQRALNLPEPGMDPTASQQRGQLAISVYKSTAAQLTSEEISTIKKQIAKVYAPIVAYRAAELLGEPVSPAK